MTDPNPSDGFQQQEANAKAQTDLLKAQTELLKAQTAYAQANKPPDAAALADAAEKARLERLKDTLEARKAVAESLKNADLAAAQAAIGTLSKSGIEGTVALKTDAGKGEATLLAARALRLAAGKVAAAIAGVPNFSKRVVLLQSAEYAQFGNFRQYLLQYELLTQQFAMAQQTATTLLGDGDRPEAGEPTARPEGAGLEAIPALTSAGVALDAVAKLGSYFMSNYEFGGIGLTSDTDQLISAVGASLIGENIAVVLPGRRTPSRLQLKDLLGDLPEHMAAADRAIANLGAKGQSLRDALAAAGVDGAKKHSLQEALAGCDQTTTALKNVVAKAGEFIGALSLADAKGQVLATKISQEKEVVDQLVATPPALALIVDVRAMAGGFYTKKNLWTLFGMIPFYVMGGAVVAFQLVDKDGLLRASGLVPIHGGYRSVRDVEKLMEE